MLIGLTGGIGSGKSALAQALERRGARLVDADRLAHQVIETPEIRAQLKAAFGTDIVGSDGQLDRREIGRRAFASAAAHQLLTQIVRPALERELWQRVDEAGGADPDAVVVVDAPLILEWGIQGKFDTLVTVTANEELRRTRVARRGLSQTEWQQRSAAQLPATDKASAADHTVDNSGDLCQLEAAADRLWEVLMAPGHHRVEDADSHVEEPDPSH